MEKKSSSKLLSYLSYTSTTLRLVGLWPATEKNSKADSGIKGILNFVYFVVVALSLIVQAGQMLTNCWINYTNFESAAESIGPMMALVTSFGKMCIYRRQRAILGRLIQSLENCLNHGPSEVLENLENYVKYGSLGCGSLLGMSWLLTVGYLSAPIVGRARVLPFASWYPFDLENSMILYSLAYSHEVFLTVLGCCTMSTEITFVLSIFHCCARLKVLRGKLETVADPESHDNYDDFHNKIGAKLSSIVKLHCEILRDIEEINFAYTYIVMVLFFAAVIAICCAGLQVTSDSAESTSWTILFLVLAMYYAEQLLFYYLPSEILVQEALAVSFSAYACGWESFEIKHRKTIGLMIMRSYEPPKLLAGNLSPLRLENYNAFLTTTASYFTSIRAVADA
nr:olfactory receptor 30 [Gregopimpla kuwanae]